MEYMIELRDTDFNILERIEKEVYNLKWEYNRMGGCGNFSFQLPRKYDDLGGIGGDYNIRIYKRTGVGIYTLWYQGLIEDRTPNLADKEYIDVKGFGYSAQLSRVYVSATYTTTEISVIVKAILDTYVTPNTDITYVAGDVVATSFTPDTLEFKNVTALSAIQQLAEMTGTREWGVGSDRKFFFKARSETVSHYFVVGKDIQKISDMDSFKDIINRVKIEGGDVAGVKFTRTINDTASQTKYGLREKVIQNAAVVTNAVADQLGDAILDEKSNVIRRASLTMAGEETQIESSIPLGAAIIKIRGVRYGEKLYGTFLYSDNITYQIDKVIYLIGDNGLLTKQISFGQKRPVTSENIKQLLYEIEQLRAARE